MRPDGGFRLRLILRVTKRRRSSLRPLPLVGEGNSERATKKMGEGLLRRDPTALRA